MSPLPMGRGGTSRFTAVSHRPHVSWHPCLHLHLCQSLFMRYFLQFFTDSFQILRYSDPGEDFETFRDLGSVFTVTEGH